MTDYQKWLERVDNLLQVQRDRCLDLISANFTRRELIELKMMIEVLMEKVLEEQGQKTDTWSIKDVAKALEKHGFGRLEQEPKTDILDAIREEISEAMDMEPAYKGQDNYIGGLQIACSIIDKYRQEAK